MSGWLRGSTDESTSSTPKTPKTAREGVLPRFRWHSLPMQATEKQADSDHLCGGLPEHCSGIISTGKVAFGRSLRVKRAADYAVVLRDKTRPEDVVELLSKTWGLKKPRVVISITGGAQDGKMGGQAGMALSASLGSDASAGLEQFVLKNLQQGLAAAAKATDAWMFTGGTDTGIMSATGAALRSSVSGAKTVPCIGIAVLKKVTHHDTFLRPKSQPLLRRTNVSRFERERVVQTERRVHYVKRVPNSDRSAGLDSNHTHFVLVDGCKGWRDEIALRSQIESTVCVQHGLPHVTLVVGGGTGTLDTIVASLSAGSQVILVRESGGAAQALCEYVEPLLEIVRNALSGGTIGGEGGVGSGLGSLEAAEDDKEALIARLINDDALDKRDTDFSERLRQLLGRKGAYDSISESELASRSTKLRRAAKYANLLTIYSVRVDAGRSLDEAVMNAIVSSFKLRDAAQRAAERSKSRQKQLLPLEGGSRTHVAARSAHPDYTRRQPVPDARVPWRVAWPSYAPCEFSHAAVLSQPRWADPPDPLSAHGLRERLTAACKPSANLDTPRRLANADSRESDALRSECFLLALGDAKVELGIKLLDANDGRPRNPRGRTGMTGRGLLGRWGPNEAADLIATRFVRDDSSNERSRRLTMLAVQRQDTGQWAIPGGMVLEDETPVSAARRQFASCCGGFDDSSLLDAFDRCVDDAFDEVDLVYRGYVDDPRNTDNAWIETRAFHIHLPDRVNLPMRSAGDSTEEAAQWITVDAEHDARYAGMHGNHKEMVDMVADTLNPHTLARREFAAYPPRAQISNDNVRWAVANHEYRPPSFTAESVLMRSADSNVQRAPREVPAEGSTSPRPRHSGLMTFVARRASLGFGMTWRDSSMGNDSADFDDLADLAEGSGALALGHAADVDEEHDADPIDISTITVELRRRSTYETPISFEPGSGHPINPRGRTGLRGRGELNRWGPNHRSDPLVTRYDPRTNQLQLAVRARRLDELSPTPNKGGKPDRGDGAFKWAIPGGMTTKPGAPLSDCLRHALLRDVLSHGKASDEQRCRLEQLLEEMIGGLEESRKHVVYSGYVDDPRNTDNSWIETTACHFHCSRELGALLPLSDRHQPDLDDPYACYWVDLRHLKGRTLHADDSGGLKLLQIINERLERQKQQGLLAVVASWGRNDFLQRVLQSPALLSFRRPEALAAALQQVLQQASDPSFDVGLVMTLLEHGATTSDLYLPDLFRSINADPFGYFAEVREGRYDPIDKLLGVKMDLRNVHLPLPYGRARRSNIAQGSDLGDAGTRCQGTSVRTSGYSLPAERQGTTSTVRESRGSEDHLEEPAMVAASPPIVDAQRSFNFSSRVKWLEEWLRFRKESKQQVTTTDGGVDGVGLRKARSLSPLQVARSISGTSSLQSSHGVSEATSLEEADEASSILLIGGTDQKWLVENRAETPAVITPWLPAHVNLMTTLVPGFDDYATRQRYVRTQDLVVWAQAAGRMELAHLLWTRCHSPLRTALIAAKVCDKIARQRSALENELETARAGFTQGALGILDHLLNLGEARKLLQCDTGEFTTLGKSGRKCTSVLDLGIEFDNKDFIGHRSCQRVLDELWWGHSPRCGSVRLQHEPSWWRIYASPLAMCMCLKLLPLEANDLYAHPPGRQSVPILRQMIDMWRIPLIKRSTTFAFFFFFLIIFVFGFAFLPMCGPLTWTHFVAAGWLLTIGIEEGYLCYQSYSLWKANRQARSFASALVLLAIGCVLRWHQRDAHVRPSLFTEPSVTQLLEQLSRNSSASMLSPAYALPIRSNDTSLWGYLFGALQWDDLAEFDMCPQSVEDEVLRMVRISPYLPTPSPEISRLPFDHPRFRLPISQIIGLGILPLFMRLFELLDFAKSFGVILMCMRGMLGQMVSWMVPMLFLDLAFSTAFSVMAPNYHAENSGPPMRFFRHSSWDLSTGGSFWLPFWGMFGIIAPQEVGSSAECAVLAPFLLWFYLLFALVLFINLLIAMFNETYVAITERSEAQWKMMRVNKVKAYYARYPVSAPFILPCLLIQLFSWPIRRLLRSCGGLFGRCSRGASIEDELPAWHQTGGNIDPKEAALIEMAAFERYLAHEQTGPPAGTRKGGVLGGAATANEGTADPHAAKLSGIEERVSAMELAASQRQADLLDRIDELIAGRRSHITRSASEATEAAPGASMPTTPNLTPRPSLVPAPTPLVEGPQTPAEAQGRVEPQLQPRRPGARVKVVAPEESALPNKPPLSVQAPAAAPPATAPATALVALAAPEPVLRSAPLEPVQVTAVQEVVQEVQEQPVQASTPSARTAATPAAASSIKRRGRAAAKTLREGGPTSTIHV